MIERRSKIIYSPDVLKQGDKNYVRTIKHWLGEFDNNMNVRQEDGRVVITETIKEPKVVK